MQANPLRTNFSPASGGSQKAIKTMKTMATVGTTAMALYIGDRRFRVNEKANRKRLC